MKHVEVCRGTERFRVPAPSVQVEGLPLRQTWILHRTSGEIEGLGGPERWQRLSKRQQVRKAGPARLSLTVFGHSHEDMRDPGRSESAAGSGKRLPEGAGKDPQPERAEKRVRFTDAEAGVQVSSVERPPSDSLEAQPDPASEVPIVGHPPKNVARHGPAFLQLGKDDQTWIRQIHHRMGHPDVEKLTRFLKHTHADPRIVAGARDYQCDACLESHRGFRPARPASIHENIGFNALVGMDMVSWTNALGTPFEFLHVIDEGTLFHVARSCGQDAPTQLQTFEEMWMLWAGPPKAMYVDPGSSFASEFWLNAMQSHDIRLNMTAVDSHWQLGRTEAHGGVLKRMLTRMDVEKPIRDLGEFREALTQAVCAKNTLSRINGYTPEQAVLGIARHLPASVTSCESGASHSQALGDQPADVRFQERLAVRTLARKAFIEADNCNSLRRALLRRARPPREDYEKGDWVLYWRRRAVNLRRELGKWYGPARVVLVERKRVVWLTHGSRLIRQVQSSSDQPP